MVYELDFFAYIHTYIFRDRMVYKLDFFVYILMYILRDRMDFL